ncbi:SIS domain-containing protein [Paenibacillus pasadenensis]|uniref:6-phospho-3-hexuloisomerase n=1 Tax=Paenibacillus pasadenensis TaxID=217090 RepID=UPI00203C9E8A|nr:6-phospho-3-hexuloisomerase [Paenibacillus pasadenensis]MCM3747689.1 SIS domain-containing protein [Paenibacillus pasadenensis]
MSMTAHARTAAAELTRAVEGIDAAAAEEFAQAVLAAGRSGGVFLAGAGRSGLMGRAFAMRLAHLGLRAYVVGETVTPGIGAGGLLVCGSGSGGTESLLLMARKARSSGAAVALVTAKPQSPLALDAGLTVALPASAKEEGGGAQPMGTLFEQALLLFFDAVVLRLMELLELDGSSMFGRHANLE